LKPADVEEPIDRWFHRPLAYVVAKLAYPTPLTPDVITVLSIVAGIAAAACLVLPFRFHAQLGGALIALSAIFDCADGQLARMRKSSSAFGRMLDGMADLIVVVFVGPASIYLGWKLCHKPAWLGWLVLVGGALTCVTSSFHTTMYDHYKNTWLRFTDPKFKEDDGETYDHARARWEEVRGQKQSIVHKVSWFVYLFYLKNARDFVRGFDPKLVDVKPTTPEEKALWRKHGGPPWAILRSWFGLGALLFGLAVFDILEIPQWYIVLRVIVLNAVFFGWLRGRQRRATREMLAELATSDSARTGSAAG
jgi:phosphatidylglycerophosphate synthase